MLTHKDTDRLKLEARDLVHTYSGQSNISPAIEFSGIREISILHDKPDDYLVTLAPYKPQLNERVYNSANEAAHLAMYVVHLLGGDRDLTDIRERAVHEHEHGVAMAALGITALYGFSLQEASHTGILFQMFSVHGSMQRPITKLEVASSHAAPTRLSRGDIVALSELGYEGTEDVTDRIMFQRAKGIELPIPLSSRHAIPLPRAYIL